MRSIRAAFCIVVIGLLSVSVVHADVLGVASDFNAVIFGDLTATGGDTEGRLAVGGNATMSYYSVGAFLDNSHGTQDNLIVGGTLNAIGGWQVYNGNAVYGQSLLATPTLTSGTIRQDTLLDFDAIQTDLAAKSASWAELESNGTANYQWSELTLTGTDSQLNIIDVSSEDWARASNRIIHAPAGSTVLINISGSRNSMRGGLTLSGGITKATVLYNFYETTELQSSAIGVLGSVLAPLADLELVGGHIDGVTIVNNAVTSGGGEFHISPFEGTLPSDVPEPTTLALLGLGGLGMLIRRKR